MAVQFWFEFGSTYSYPAALRVEEVARARGVALQWRAFLLGPIFRAQGWNDSPFNLYAAKGRYMWRDLERLCEQLAIPFRRPSQFPRNGLLAARVAAWFADEAWLPSFVRAVYRANFADDRDIADRAVVAECLQAAGQEPAPALDAASAEPAKERLRACTEEAERLGIFGAPTWVVGGELFWGQDRLEAALDADRAARASAPGEVQGDLAVEVESIPLQSDPMERRREIETRGAASDSDEIWRGLALYNLAAWGELFTPLRVFLRDARGCIHGGLLGNTGGEVLFVAQLWVAEALRRRGLGRSLLRAAEQEALRRGCRVAHLDTFDFQAPEFYAGLGYRPFGRLEGYRGGRVRHYLCKALA